MTKWEAMSHEARELALWIENTAEIYHAMVEPTITALARHRKRGKYETAKAVKAWRRVADHAAKHYAKTYDFERNCNKIFSVDDRKACAVYIEDAMLENVDWEVKHANDKNH